MGWNLTDIFWNMRQNTDLGEKQHVESDLETCLISLVLPVIQMTVRMLGALWFGFVDYNHLAAHMNSVIFWGFISTTSFHSIQLIVDIVPIPAMLPTTTFEPWPWLLTLLLSLSWRLPSGRALTVKPVVFDSGLGELNIDSISNSFEIKLEYPHGCV